jgi:hypothetical protein
VTPRLDIAIKPVSGTVPRRGVGAAFNGEPVGAAATLLDCLREASLPYQREHTVPV